MATTRRHFLTGAAASVALPYIRRPAFAREPGRRLPIPPLVETSAAPSTLVAQEGVHPFLDGVSTPTWGFGQSYLGPVLKFRRGREARMRVTNRLANPITCHWHGLHVPAIVDGGPQLEIPPGKTWQADLPVDQPASTLWYHSHAHGVTAEHVYYGLSGLIIVDDETSDQETLPSDYGVDDIPLIIQDRAFSETGALAYFKRGPMLMHGFRANTIVVNGAVVPTADVPAGIVRLRLLNGSNARIYHLRFSDGRTFHRIASDGGRLPAPVGVDAMSLAPAERAEVLVDFSDGGAVALLSGPDTNDPMGGGGMMGGMMAGMIAGDPPQSEEGRRGAFDVMRFQPDRDRQGRIAAIPNSFAGAPGAKPAEAEIRREFVLNMHVGGRGMGGGMGRGMGLRGGGMMGTMGINDRPYDPGRIDVRMQRGVPEIWRVRSLEMAHPFHVHGTAFQVLSLNGAPVPFETTGLKDVFLVDGEAEILVQADHPASSDIPYMFHCHILEHEDAGMMGQFTVE